MSLATLPMLASTMPDVWGILFDILVLLAVAVVLGAIAERLGQSVIVGYLIAGTLVGPRVLGWVSTDQELFAIAELGVALLLFAIGLEFSPRRLFRMRTGVLWTGLLQVVLTTGIASGAAMLFGLDPREAIVVGMMVAVSSTACVLRLLTDRAEVDSEHGRASLGILLIQDAAVVPMMLLVSVLATGGSWVAVGVKLGLSLVLASAVVALFYFLFNIIAPRLLQMPTLRRNRDLPVLVAVIMATGSAWLTHRLGLSPALGAFVAGMMLAASPFATQIRADTRPLATLMIALFFAAIGMFGDPAWLAGHWAIVAVIVLVIIAGKPLLIAVLARAFGHPWRYAIATALCLAQVGEFSFVLATTAQSAASGEAIMSPVTFRAMVSATIITLLVTPYLVALGPWAGARWDDALTAVRMRRARAVEPGAIAEKPADEAADGLIIIVGFGPAGQRVAEGLIGTHGPQLVAIDLHAQNIAIAQRYGLACHVGDATHRDILEHAGIGRARVIVLTVPAPDIARELIDLVRDIAPEVFIVARCRYHMMHYELLGAGAHEVVDEEDHLGRRLAAEVRRFVREE